MSHRFDFRPGDKRVNIFDVANDNRRYLSENGTPKKLDTAAPTPEQAELAFRQALDKVGKCL